MSTVRKCTVVAGWGTNFPFDTFDDALEDILLKRDERTRADLSSGLYDGCYLVVAHDSTHSKGSTTIGWDEAIRFGKHLGILDEAGMLKKEVHIKDLAQKLGLFDPL